MDTFNKNTNGSRNVPFRSSSVQPIPKHVENRPNMYKGPVQNFNYQNANGEESYLISKSQHYLNYLNQTPISKTEPLFNNSTATSHNNLFVYKNNHIPHSNSVSLFPSQSYIFSKNSESSNDYNKNSKYIVLFFNSFKNCFWFFKK